MSITQPQQQVEVVSVVGGVLYDDDNCGGVHDERQFDLPRRNPPVRVMEERGQPVRNGACGAPDSVVAMYHTLAGWGAPHVANATALAWTLETESSQRNREQKVELA